MTRLIILSLAVGMAACTRTSDWVIAQYDLDGRPQLCWVALHVVDDMPDWHVHRHDPIVASMDIRVQTEGARMETTGRLVRVEVLHGDVARASQLLDVDPQRCMPER